MDYDDLLFILKKEHEFLKKYQELKHESDMKMQENTYKEMLLFLRLINPNWFSCKLNLKHLPSDAFMKKTV